MRIFKLLVILLLLPLFVALAQTETITVTGTMKDEDGNPIAGLSVTIKGTSKGTITDFNGNYEIKAPLGSTLVFTFIGMKPREATVTRNGLLPQNSRTIIPYNPKTTVEPDKSKELERLRQQEAYAKRMKHYQTYLTLPIDTTWARANIEDASKKEITKASRQFDSGANKNYSLGWIELNTSFAVNPIGRLPQLQHSFAQGRPLNNQYSYQGPETGEIFSWGPKLNNLEYNGLTYPYDNNGALVGKGTGNGMAANSYDADNFLKDGFTNRNDITLHQRILGLKTDLNYGNLFSQGNLPGSEVQNHTVSLKVASQKHFDAWVRYQQQNDELQNRLLQSKIFYSALITPPSFDNTNGLSTKNANKNQSSIYTSQGTLRSFSPNHVDNPFYLTQNLENPSEQRLLAGQATVSYDIAKSTSMTVSAGGESSTDEQNMAMEQSSTILPSSYQYHRTEEQNTLHLATTIKFDPNQYRSPWEWLSVNLPIRLESKERNVRASEEIAQSIDEIVIDDQRSTLTLSPMIKADFLNFLTASVTANVYASNTADKTYVNPSLGLSINPFEMMDEWFGTFISANDLLRISANYSQMPVEYNFAPKPGMANTLLTPSSSFITLRENIETVPALGIHPEILTQKGLNLSINPVWFLKAEFNLFDQQHQDAIFPIVATNSSTLQNMADYNNRGWEASVSFDMPSTYKFKWNSDVVMSHQKSEVTKVAATTPLAVAGFADVNTALMVGEPVGVIVGSSYMTDANGNTIIGDDGFPLVDATPKAIGNPTPKLRLGFDNSFKLQMFELRFLIDARLGGQIWNGTRATLDYYGASAQTGNERYTQDYIFEGVTQDGKPNQTTVDFAPRNGYVAQNRWVRYGETGVAKAYIEDATQIVLREISLGYTVQNASQWGFNQLKISVFALNMAAIAGYKGVVPDNTMWGHASGQGLDYFNTPLAQSFGFKLETRF
jgi:hypothetical protein